MSHNRSPRARPGSSSTLTLPVSPRMPHGPPGGVRTSPEIPGEEITGQCGRRVRPGSLLPYVWVQPSMQVEPLRAHLSSLTQDGLETRRVTCRSCMQAAPPTSGVKGPEDRSHQESRARPWALSPGSPATLRALWAVWVMGEVTATGGVLPFFRDPGGPRPAGFFSSPALDASSQLSGRSRRHLDAAGSIFRLPLSYSSLRGAFSSDSLNQLSPLSASERFSESVRSWRRERAGWMLSGTGRAGTEGEWVLRGALLSRGTRGPRLPPAPQAAGEHSAHRHPPNGRGHQTDLSPGEQITPQATAWALPVPSRQLEDSIPCTWGPIPRIGTRSVHATLPRAGHTPPRTQARPGLHVVGLEKVAPRLHRHLPLLLSSCEMPWAWWAGS